jgi:CPA2 family monovalent cation:H+ antiporter-2
VNFIAEVRRRQQSSVLWMLCKKRLIQVGLEILLVSTVLIFAPALLVFIHEHLPVEGVTEAVVDLIFWITLGLFCLLPLQAIWRNTEAMAMIMIDFAAQSQPAVLRRGPYILFGLKSVAALLLILWLGALIPVESGQAWLLVGFALVLLGVLVLMRSKLIYWHSMMENSVESVLRRDSPVANHTLTSQLAQCADWPLELSECELPDRFALAGSTIAESGLRAKHGVSIVMIERQGMAISAPSPSSHLFPYDKLLLLGNRDDLPGARDYLTAEAVGESDDTKHFGSLVLDTLVVTADSPRCGKTLGMLNLTRLFGVQVVGIERQGKRFSEITAFTQLQAEDHLLVLGTPARIEEFRHWLEREPNLI